MTPQRQLAVPAYLVAFSFAAIPPVDAFMQTVPVHLSNTRWRFGAYGLLSNALMLPLLGLLLAFLIAIVFDHRRFQKVLGVISGVIGVLTLAGFCVFVLDILQLKGQVMPGAQPHLAFTIASITACLKALLGIVTLGFFAYAGFKVPKAKKPVQATRPSGMLVGTSVAPAPAAAAVVGGGARVAPAGAAGAAGAVKKEQV